MGTNSLYLFSNYIETEIHDYIVLMQKVTAINSVYFITIFFFVDYFNIELVYE